MTDIKKVGEEIYYYGVVDERFKFNIFTINFVVELNEKTAARNAVLCSLLRQSCKKYYDNLQIGKKLRSLYGANLFCDVKKAGREHIIIFGIEVLDDEFAFEKENLAKNAVELMLEIIFNPKIENGAFSEKEVLTEKKEVEQILNAIYADKKDFALQQAFKTLFQGKSLSVGPYGDFESLATVDCENLVESYMALLLNSRVFVSCCLRRKQDELLDLIFSRFNRLKRVVSPIKREKHYFDFMKEKKEHDSLQQAKVVVVFAQHEDLLKTNEFEDEIAIEVFNCLFGGSAVSLLFNNVREKLSLCYYCKSTYDIFLGVVVVESGVEKKDVDRFYSAMLEQFESIKKGCFSDDELKQAQYTLETSYRKILDSQGRILAYGLNCFLRKENFSVEEIVVKIKSVTRKDVERVAKKFMVALKYVLEEKEG